MRPQSLLLLRQHRSPQHSLLGNLSPASRAVYLLVGLAAVYQALQWKAIQHRWHLAHS